jgi:OFA family oxalate/formate antiporter-like MFS transporter
MIDKIRVVLGACGIHICIGSVYAWSVLTNPIADMTGWNLSAITFAFSIAIFFLGMSAGFLGKYVQSWGAKRSSLVSCVCFVSGLLGSALAIHAESLALLYIFYGVLGGIGLGVGYIAPVATLLKRFPHSKGFAGGCAVMSFGFSAVIAGPLMQYIIELVGLEMNFIIMALSYTIIMILSAFLLDVKPPRKNPKRISTYNMDDNTFILGEYDTKEATHTKEFRILWFVFFVNISAGIAILSIASPMGEEIGMSAAEAAGMVGMIGLLNGGGRIFFASISDFIGRKFTYSIFFLSEIIAFWVLSKTTNPYLFQNIVFIIIACYGGGFSCMPAYLSDMFGNKYLSAIHGRILTAWGVAGIVGPMTITLLYEKFGTHNTALILFAVLFIVNLILIQFMAKRRY